jgi:hypothetical protein
MRFRLHPDQNENVRLALDTMKAEIGTVYDDVALDALATFFLSHLPARRVV